MRNGPRSRGNTLALGIGIDVNGGAGPSRSQTAPPERERTRNSSSMSPTTPRASRFPIDADVNHTQGMAISNQDNRSNGEGQDGDRFTKSPGPLTVNVSMDPEDGHSPPSPVYQQHPYSTRDRGRSIPSSPTDYTPSQNGKGKSRTLSVDRRDGTGGDDGRDLARERRQSQVSAHSATSIVNSAAAKPSIKDYDLGEELGQGSYSTVSSDC